MSGTDVLSTLVLGLGFGVACWRWASLFDRPALPTARYLRKQYRRQRADLRRVLRGRL